MVKLSKYIKMIKICQIKAGVHLKDGILAGYYRFNENKRKNVLEYHQTVERPRRSTTG